MTNYRWIGRPGNEGKGAQQDTIRADQLGLFQRADELITHQHVIRRFKTQHQKDFELLCKMRSELNVAIEDRPEPKANAARYPKTRLVAEAANFLGKRKNLLLYSQGWHTEAASRLREDLAEVLSHESEDATISREEVQKILDILSRYAPLIIDVHERLNYLDYYSPFGLTCYVSGEDLYRYYTKAMSAKLAITSYASTKPETISPDFRWLYLEFDDRTNKDISALLDGVPYKPWYTSRNVEIFGGSQHEVHVDQRPLKNRLILSVPTDEIPDRIDDTLQAFREAFMQEYINNSRSQKLITTYEFDHSYFMNQKGSSPCFVKGDWRHFRRSVAGLWTWDFCWSESTELDPASAYIQRSLAEMNKGVPSEIRKKAKLEDYLASSIRSYYSAATNEIRVSPFMNKTDWADDNKIDYHVTRDPYTVLGERDSTW